MQDIKERKLEDSGSIANTEICFEVRATALRPHLHTEGFPLMRPHRTSHTGNLPEDLDNTNLEYTTPLSNNHNLYTRGKALSHTRSTSQ